MLDFPFTEYLFARIIERVGLFYMENRMPSELNKSAESVHEAILDEVQA